MPNAVTSGRVVLVTGASTGIGRACADALHARGWIVYGVSRTITRRVPRPVFTALDADVTREADIVAVLDRITRDHGRLDAVVNCAGYSLGGPVEETSDGQARRQFDANFHGLATVCRLVAQGFRQARAGRIVNVGSLAGHVPMAFQAYYAASKAAVGMFTRALRLELLPYGVTTVLIEPGDVATGFTAARQLAVRVHESHYPAFGRALAVVNRDETSAAGPDAIVPIVVRALEHPSPGPRYTAGPLVQRLGVALQSLLPARLFDVILRKLYELDGVPAAPDATATESLRKR